MVTLFEKEQVSQGASRIPVKSRRLNGLVRHASAPAISPLLIGVPATGEGVDISKQRVIPILRTPAVNPRSKHALVNELCLARTLTYRLRQDRDNWRSVAQKQSHDLVAAETVLQQQAQTITDLENENSQLHIAREVEGSLDKHLVSRLQDVATKHDALVDQLNDALRSITQLKKSDRSKGKVQQRNLRLKATLQHYTSQLALSNAEDLNTEAALREALALASERVEELETSGQVLLKALEQQGDSSMSDDDDGMRVEDPLAALLEAEVVFRSLLDDEAFEEQKENWAELLVE